MTYLEIIKAIQSEIEDHEKNAAKAKQKLDESFLYNFPMGYPETLYKSEFCKRELKELLDAYINEQTLFVILESQVRSILKKLKEGRFLGTSTSLFSSLSYTYDLECKAQLLSLYEYWVKEFKTY